MNFRQCYSRLLYIADKKQSDAIIDNDTFDDSADVYERIFLSCSEEVLIFARGINEKIFNKQHVIDAAVNFIQKDGTSIKFYLRARPDEDYKANIGKLFLRTLYDHVPARDKIRITYYEGDDDWMCDLGSTTIGDNRIYRYRYLQTEYRSTSKARVCFHDSDKCQALTQQIHSALSNQSIIYQI